MNEKWPYQLGILLQQIHSPTFSPKEAAGPRPGQPAGAGELRGPSGGRLCNTRDHDEQAGDKYGVKDGFIGGLGPLVASSVARDDSQEGVEHHEPEEALTRKVDGEKLVSPHLFMLVATLGPDDGGHDDCKVKSSSHI